LPAIQLARLNKQLAELRDAWPDQEDFLSALHALLEFYANPTHRVGQVGEPAPLLKSYNVPPPLVQSIVKGLGALPAQNPLHCLQICDLLWREPAYETRLLAAYLIGQIHSDDLEIIQRVEQWLETETNSHLLNVIFTVGVAGVASRRPDDFLARIEKWLANGKPRAQANGLRALHILLGVSTFDNFPACFRIITPVLRQPVNELRQELVSVLQKLARRSPVETAVYLSEILETNISPDTALVIRLTLEALPEKQSQKIQEQLRERRRENF
jgi:hypothetical protein